MLPPGAVRDAYQGSQLTWISDYALGYLLLREKDSAAASVYADRAIAFLRSALFDLQKNGTCTRQFLARGDGVTRTFTLPHSGIFPATLRVYRGSVKTIAIIPVGAGTSASSR